MATRFLLLRRLIKRTHFSLPFSSRNPTPCLLLSNPNPFKNLLHPSRNLSHGSVNLILSDSIPRFETLESEEPKRKKWQSKKRLKEQRKREKRKRREANKRDPRRIRPKGKKMKKKFATAEERIKYKIEKAKLKEALLVEKLKKYEVPKLQGPMPKPDELSGEERFYMKKMAQKRSNYVPVGRRGVFGGVILNMHLHWKKHETVKVICKPCKPGQVHEYARDIARLSGGVPIQIIGDDTIIFYRGKDYVQPEVMSPIDTLSKKKALEKSKYEQSLETVRRFIAISEKELELYYRHVALYGDPNSRNSDLVYDDKGENPCHVRTETSYSRKEECADLNDDISTDLLDTELDSEDDAVTEDEIDSDNEFTEAETESEGEGLSDSELGVDNRGK
ncbi:uncharacterized protein A4U43_C09F4660 [Asparagus officinalis]|uniref:CRM domain-containing protein n=1 Tax=Asparagus officinalis TaxID=4686 RepID=A0A5P1E745_ASPOF|nr:uncharacterized CRM domain-containing protein At3g25440, chloroplastic [Asparagus officinalis]ONK57833.1 uncharacterized protein A4U43_C09F4660 [Asparagus officinalis]